MGAGQNPLAASHGMPTTAKPCSLRMRPLVQELGFLPRSSCWCRAFSTGERGWGVGGHDHLARCSEAVSP